MNILYLLIALALVLLVFALWALFWAIGNRQFDDLESQGWSVVLDDDQKPPQASLRGSELNKSATSSTHSCTAIPSGHPCGKDRQP